MREKESIGLPDLSRKLPESTTKESLGLPGMTGREPYQKTCRRSIQRRPLEGQSQKAVYNPYNSGFHQPALSDKAEGIVW